MRAYPASRQWLTLLLRRMDAVALVYRLAATLSSGVDGLETRVELHRQGRFDAVITLHNGRSFGVVRQGLALRPRSLYDRLRAIAEYYYSRHPSAVLMLVPSPWEQRLTDEFCLKADLRDCYVGLECRETLEEWERPIWHSSNRVRPYSRMHNNDANRSGRQATYYPYRNSQTCQCGGTSHAQIAELFFSEG